MTTLPLSRAATLSARFYLDPAVLEREKEQVFGATWQLPGRPTQVLTQHQSRFCVGPLITQVSRG